MGEIINVACLSCKTKWTCETGCGIFDADLEKVADSYPENIRRKIKKYAEKSEFPLFDFAYKLSVCPSCNNIKSVPVLNLRDDNIEYIGTCKECGAKTKLIEQIENTHCPVCQNVSLEWETIGQWD